MVAISGMADSSLVTNLMAFSSVTNFVVSVGVKQDTCGRRCKYLHCIPTPYFSLGILLSRRPCAFDFSLSARFYLRICCFPDFGPIRPFQCSPGHPIAAFHIEHPDCFERGSGR